MNIHDRQDEMTIMSGSEWAPWATLAVGIVTAVTAVLLGGALTYRGRLERRLEKLVAICDKLPAGAVRTDLERLATRVGAELLVRSSTSVRIQGRYVTAGAVAGGIAAFVLVWSDVLGPSTVVTKWLAAAGFVLGFVITGLAAGWQDRVRTMADRRLRAADAADAAENSPPSAGETTALDAAQSSRTQDDPPVDQGQRVAS